MYTPVRHLGTKGLEIEVKIPENLTADPGTRIGLAFPDTARELVGKADAASVYGLMYDHLGANEAATLCIYDNVGGRRKTVEIGGKIASITPAPG